MALRRMCPAHHDHITTRLERRQVAFLKDAAAAFAAVIRVAGTQRYGRVIHHFGVELARFAVDGQQPVGVVVLGRTDSRQLPEASVPEVKRPG